MVSEFSHSLLKVHKCQVVVIFPYHLAGMTPVAVAFSHFQPKAGAHTRTWHFLIALLKPMGNYRQDIFLLLL